jgi:hypothetical protein
MYAEDKKRLVKTQALRIPREWADIAPECLIEPVRSPADTVEYYDDPWDNPRPRKIMNPLELRYNYTSEIF